MRLDALNVLRSLQLCNCNSSLGIWVSLVVCKSKEIRHKGTSLDAVDTDGSMRMRCKVEH